MEMAEEEALAEFRVNACLQSCIQYIIYHRKCSISYSTNEPFQMGPDKKKTLCGANCRATSFTFLALFAHNI